MNTAELLAIAADIVASREAVVGEDLRLTFSQVIERTGRLTAALWSLGVRRGDRVAALALNCPQYVETYYACARLGAVFVPLNYRAKQDELAYMLTDSDASVLFIGQRYLPLLNFIRQGLRRIQHYICYEAAPEGMHPYQELVANGGTYESRVEVDESHLALIMYTSGTTAQPKGVILTHQALATYVLNTVEPATPDTHHIQLVAVPFYHIAGATTMLSAMFAGRTLVVLPQFDPEAWLEAVEGERVTHSFVVPTMLKRIMDQPNFHKHDLSSLQLLAYGAAPMPYDVIRRAVEVFSCDLLNAYGQTESTSTLTYLGPEDHRIERLTDEEKEKKLRRLRSVGRPMSDVEIAIMDPQGHILAPGQEGEIVAKGARIMAGYWQREAETAQALSDGWLHTGDVGYLDEDGYLFITGRAKDLIIRGGENIAPGEIEAVLEGHPKVAEAAVVGIPDREWGEEVKAIVILKPGQAASVEELQQYCRSRLASYKCPRYVSFVSDLPRNHLGKVLKTEIRRTYGAPADELLGGKLNRS